MKTLTATEMGFPENYMTHAVAFALKDGYAVGHPNDAYPSLQRVTPQGETEPLYQTKDSGRTWEPVGEFYKNAFDDWSLRFYEEDN